MKTGIDLVLDRIQSHIGLDQDTEREILDEIRTHLEEAVAAAQARGENEMTALSQAAARFGVEETGIELQETHAGWGTANAVIAAGLPVVCTVVLRWLVFAPEGTALHWTQVISRPALWLVAGAALIIPLVKFHQWRYALASWAVFWVITVIGFVFATPQW